jgi:hypothetical protein
MDKTQFSILEVKTQILENEAWAAALLLIKGGIQGLFAKVISTSAKEVLEQAGIPLQFEREVPRILNRTGDGFCPMESATQGITDPEEAFAVLLRKREEMRK